MYSMYAKLGIDVKILVLRAKYRFYLSVVLTSDYFTQFELKLSHQSTSLQIHVTVIQF